MKQAQVLSSILASKRMEILRLHAGPRFPPRHAPLGGVLDALRRPPGSPLRLLAEIKLRSPSAGALSSALPPARRAIAYAEAGARMISVLVDRPFFGGSYEDLASCRAALDEAFGLSRPRLLCKEFVLDRVQLQMASSFGADAVLLIARLHPPERLAELAFEARKLLLEPLVEITNEAELSAAQAVEASLIGVNARDLDTLVMDQERAANVLAKIDPRVVRVHLSGLSRPEDVARVASGSADAALIGEALMRQDDPRPLLSAMVASAFAPLTPPRRS